MHTVMTVIRKKPEIGTEEFRRFMEHDYGPTYQGLPETKSYVQHFLTDLMTDGAEEPIDAIVQISFESEDAMRQALRADSYRQAAKMRERYLRETSVGIHSAVVDKTVELV